MVAVLMVLIDGDDGDDNENKVIEINLFTVLGCEKLKDIEPDLKMFII